MTSEGEAQDVIQVEDTDRDFLDSLIETHV